jgi:hypothetical protein
VSGGLEMAPGTSIAPERALTQGRHDITVPEPCFQLM